MSELLVGIGIGVGGLTLWRGRHSVTRWWAASTLRIIFRIVVGLIASAAAIITCAAMMRYAWTTDSAAMLIGRLFVAVGFPMAVTVLLVVGWAGSSSGQEGDQ